MQGRIDFFVLSNLMEQYNRNEEGIFHMGIEERGKAYMLEISRWAKFLSIIGLIIAGFLFLAMLFVLLGASEISRQLGSLYGVGAGVGIFFFYLLILLIVFYPSITLLKFANKVKLALNTANQDMFNEALRNLKNTFKFWGIYVIVMLAIYGLSILFVIITAAVAGS